MSRPFFFRRRGRVRRTSPKRAARRRGARGESMTLGSMKTTAAVATLLACLVGTAIVKAQQAADRPLLSDQVFKNVQVMKGIPVDQFMATMGFFSASLGMSCEDCHMADDPDDAEDQRRQLRRPPDGDLLLLPSWRRLAADGP